MIAADILNGLIRVNLAAAAAIVGVIVLRGMVRRPFGARLAYGLWLLPMLAGAAVLAPARQVVIVQAAAPVFRPTPEVRIPLAATQLPIAPVAASSVPPVVASPPSAPMMSLDPLALLVGLWLAGAGGAALVMTYLQQRFVLQARRGAVGPAVVGVLAPRIVTPWDFGERYSQGEQALVLAHEEAHIARQDSRMNGLCALVQCLCWFNPLVHLGARLMRIDQELACDEAVVTRFPTARRAYAEVLLKAQMAVLPLPLGCYWPSKTKHPLVERVALLKLRSVTPARRWAGGAALTILCTGAGLAAWASQPANVRIRISPAPDGRAAQLAPVAAVAAAASETSAAGDSLADQPRDEGGAAPVNIAAGYALSGQTPSEAATPPRADHADGFGPLDVTGDRLERDDPHHLARWRGNVEAVFGGNHLTSDVLEVYFLGKSADGTAARPISEAVWTAVPVGTVGIVGPDWGGLQKVQAEGHVTFVSTDKTAKADQAVYDRTLNTITLSGNVVLVQGGKESRAEKLVIDLKAGHAAMSNADGRVGELVVHQTERAAAVALPTAPAQAIPSATPVALVTRPAEAGRQASSFVQSYAVSTAKLGQIARWGDPLCVQVIGLVPDKAAQVRARIEAVAKGVGQSVLASGCTPNIEVAFTDKPQSLIDKVAARQEALLGYNHRDAKALKTVTRPIQAWYVTATVARGGTNVGTLFSLGGDVMGARAGMSPMRDRITDDPDSRSPMGCGDSRFSSCLASVFDNVLVVVDTGRLRDNSLGPVSDYVAMLALSQPRSLDGCNALPSVTDLFASACPGRAAPGGLTPADAAYLTSLYASDPEGKMAGEQSDIAGRMAKILTAANVAAR